jgi:glyoxylase-like metal-dependent hydrolase (beta-lactamase superfamily II)
MENKKQSYIEWIGTGSGLNPILGHTSFVVRGNSDRALLVDCGGTVPIELLRQGKLMEITDVLITHPHGDHMHGLEGLGFANYFMFRRRNENRPNLYLATDTLAHDLWENGLKVSMRYAQTDEGLPMDATLETYFKVNTGNQIKIPGLPEVDFFPTHHVHKMESYGIRMGEQIWYSGDTLDLPVTPARLIFQDCQFYETKSDVHVSYDKLKRELSDEVRARVHLVHLGGGWDKKDAKADGFAGFVKPGDRFYLSGDE